MHRKEQADRILYDLGLLCELEKYGSVHLVGSYRMDAMAWNDLDIDVSNKAMNTEKLYRLTAFIIKTFSPTWYEAKQEVNSEGKTVWFHGFEAIIDGALWNVDIWFFDKDTIRNAEAFCEEVRTEFAHNPLKKNAAIEIKQYLIENGLYAFDRFTSMDVYKAVLETGIATPAAFLAHFESK